MVVQLREGGGAVAVEHLVRAVDLNRPEIIILFTKCKVNIFKRLNIIRLDLVVV
jgi:hypothetical protein